MPLKVWQRVELGTGKNEVGGQKEGNKNVRLKNVWL